MSQNPVQEAVFNRASETLDANLRMPLLLFSDHDADTFVYIEPAPQQEDDTRRSQSYRWGPSMQSETQPIPHRMHSRKLLDTGSDVLKDLFLPRSQARVRKRYGLSHCMPPGVKYAIDLTPPVEGDEAVIFMTELSCPMGVRKWAGLQSWWKLPSICVGGTDETEWLPVPEFDAQEKIDANAAAAREKDNEGQPGKFKFTHEREANMKRPRKPKPPSPKVLNWQGNLPTLREDLVRTPSDRKNDPEEIKEITVQKEPEPSAAPSKLPGLPLDYSPIRHRTCLERVLHALEGLDPKIDTAPNLWTFFALSKLLQVATLPAIGDRILAWLYQDNNVLFVEANPELAYQIACGLQNRSLCQDSFAILVGEEALLVLDSLLRGVVPKSSNRTMHGRNREPLDDTDVQRVEYASKIFVDRILSEFIKLVGTEMLWVEKIVMDNIRGSLQMAEDKSHVDRLIAFCKTYVRGQIYQFLVQHFPRAADSRFQPILDAKCPGQEHQLVLAHMPVFCRVLTRTFWKNIGDASVLTDVHVWKHSSLKELAPKLPCLRNQDDATIRSVSSLEVDSTISEFQDKVNASPHGRERWLQVYFDFTYFQCDVKEYLKGLSARMTNPPNAEQIQDLLRPLGVQYEIVDTLVCLGEEEFKFLPLWAGGNDDGTGGVFDDQAVPLVRDGGFATAGPSIRLAGDDNDDSFSMSSFDTINPDDAASTVERASHEAANSHATTVVSVKTSVSEFELIEPIRNMDVKSNASVTEGEFDIDMGEDLGDFDFDYDGVDDDDDTMSTISDA